MRQKWRAYFYPLFVFIYTMNWILDLPCIALLRLWMWNYPIDDHENVIQGDFILSPFSIRQNIGLNRGGVHLTNTISWWLCHSVTTFWRSLYLESGYSRMTIPKMGTWEVFSMHFRNYPLIDIDTITSRKVGLLNYPHIQKVRIEKWLM